jgi:hypothetical protein
MRIFPTLILTSRSKTSLPKESLPGSGRNHAVWPFEMRWTQLFRCTSPDKKGRPYTGQATAATIVSVQYQRQEYKTGGFPPPSVLDPHKPDGAHFSKLNEKSIFSFPWIEYIKLKNNPTFLRTPARPMTPPVPARHRSGRSNIVSPN